MNQPLNKNAFTVVVAFLILASVNIACIWSAKKTVPISPGTEEKATSTSSADLQPTPSPLPENPIPIVAENSQEPVFISGVINHSSPFFVNSFAEPFVLLEDQAGFVNRDRDFEFRLQSQIIGPVELIDDNKINYYLSLPSVPQGTFVDVDQDAHADKGVQVFAISYWSNIWGDPFLEPRDGAGWSTAYASTITDVNNEDEIIGGTLIVWSPDENQKFPTDFGIDGKLFTQDDPVGPLSPGYNLVDLNQKPFRIYKETNPTIDLYEGVIAINDYSEMSYTEAFQTMFEKVSKEYPFTLEKNIDWEALKTRYFPQAKKARNDIDFFKIIQGFSQSIPDGHVNLSFNPDIFYEQYGGGIGLLLTELSDGKVVASEVLPNLPAEKAGILPGAEITTWDGEPVSAAISKIIPGFGPYSTQHTERIAQTSFLTRTKPRSKIILKFINPNEKLEKEVSLQTTSEYDTIFHLLSVYTDDPLALPIEGKLLKESGLGYVKLRTFSDDYQLLARLWEHFIASLQEEGIPGVIIDLRDNGGGSLGLAMDFSGFFFDEEYPLYQSAYYNDVTNKFETGEYPATVHPAPIIYDGNIAVLIGPDCISACEGFAYALSTGNRSILIGHYPTVGAFGEVGRGQYKFPDDISLQFPTGRPETLDGNLLIEGIGVKPDIVVPVTVSSALGEVDTVLEAAIQTLLEMNK